MYGYNAENSNYMIATNAGARITVGAGLSEIYCTSNCVSIGLYNNTDHNASGALIGRIRIDNTDGRQRTLMNTKDFGIGSGNFTLNAIGDIAFTSTGAFTSDGATVATTSDRNKKHDISYDIEKYENFFMLLKPSVFKYNNGQSDRLHTGFIAQDVYDALESCNISTQEFAAYVSVTDRNSDGDAIGRSLALRYEEFVSLNTYMIQKLYARVAELENQIQLISGGNE